MRPTNHNISSFSSDIVFAGIAREKRDWFGRAAGSDYTGYLEYYTELEKLPGAEGWKTSGILDPKTETQCNQFISSHTGHIAWLAVSVPDGWDAITNLLISTKERYPGMLSLLVYAMRFRNSRMDAETVDLLGPLFASEEPHGLKKLDFPELFSLALTVAWGDPFLEAFKVLYSHLSPAQQAYASRHFSTCSTSLEAFQKLGVAFLLATKDCTEPKENTKKASAIMLEYVMPSRDSKQDVYSWICTWRQLYKEFDEVQKRETWISITCDYIKQFHLESVTHEDPEGVAMLLLAAYPIILTEEEKHQLESIIERIIEHDKRTGVLDVLMREECRWRGAVGNERVTDLFFKLSQGVWDGEVAQEVHEKLFPEEILFELCSANRLTNDRAAIQNEILAYCISRVESVEDGSFANFLKNFIENISNEKVRFYHRPFFTLAKWEDTEEKRRASMAELRQFKNSMGGALSDRTAAILIYSLQPPEESSSGLFQEPTFCTEGVQQILTVFDIQDSQELRAELQNFGMQEAKLQRVLALINSSNCEYSDEEEPLLQGVTVQSS